ncbi:MAG: type II toxin-antitoxin system HicB family antitoxin [Candidatus Rokubacteria bacterium]|nr:type II toxin-antitoxin system HicB family antitoxin [Candidatus Rokubacteria bacterium]
MATNTYTAIIEKEGDIYVALCPELDIASQGTTIEEAKANLKEAVELFLECADPEEIRRRFHDEIFVTRFEASNG